MVNEGLPIEIKLTSNKFDQTSNKHNDSIMEDFKITDPTKIDTESILQDVLAGAEAHSAATEIFISTFTFYGKTLEDWLNEMAIQIPKEATPEILQSVSIDLATKIQRAANFYTIASAIHGGIVSGGNIKKSDLIKHLVDTYRIQNRKRPAATIIERMADSYMNSTTHTKIAAKIIKDFWKERRDTLIEIRRCIEQIGITMCAEMKYHN